MLTDEVIIILALVVMVSCDADEMCSNLTTSCVNNCVCGIRNVPLTDEERSTVRAARPDCREMMCVDADSCPTTIDLPDAAVTDGLCPVIERNCRRRNVISKDGKVIQLLNPISIAEYHCSAPSRHCEGEVCIPNQRCQSVFEKMMLPGIEVTSGKCAVFNIPRCVGCVCGPSLALEMPILPLNGISSSSVV